MRIRELLLGEAEFEDGTGDAGPPIAATAPKPGFVVGPKGLVPGYGVQTYSETDPTGHDFPAQADKAMKIVPPNPGMDMGIHSGAPPSQEVWPPNDQLI